MHEDLTDSISKSYSRRDRSKGDRYEWWQPDVLNQVSARNLEVKRFLHQSYGADLTELEVLDIGCGDGRLLRLLVDCGASPERLRGIDLLPDRIETARGRSAPGIRYSVGDFLDHPIGQQFSLVSAFTVLSSITRLEDRERVLQGMWDLVEPSGWLLIFDFRFDNPRNEDVTRVDPRWLKHRVAAKQTYFKSLLTPPPVARVLARRASWLDRCFASVLRPLRSHFIFGARRTHAD